MGGRQARNPEYSSRLIALYVVTFAVLSILIGDHIWEYFHDLDFLIEQARKEAKLTAEQVNVSVEEFVGDIAEGGKRLKQYIGELNRKTDVNVRIFRSASISGEYGAGALSLPDTDEIKLTMVDGKQRDWQTRDSFIYAMPLAASEKCVQCHHMPGASDRPVPEGYVLGVVEVKVPATAVNEARTRLLKHTATSAGLTLVSALLLLYAISRLVGMLRHSQKQMSAIIKSVGEGIIVINADSVIQSTNDELCKIFGYGEDELAGLDVKELMPEKYRAAHSAAMARYLAGNAPSVVGRHVVLEGLRRDGSVFPIEIRIEEIAGWKGRLFTAAIRDITQRVAAEEALRESGEKFRSAFEDAAPGMFMADTKGNLLRVNRSMGEMLGYTAAELAGKNSSDISHPGDMKVYQDHLRRLLSGETRTFQMEKRYLHSGGQTVWGLLNVSLMHDAQGRPHQLVGQVEDISARKQAQKDLMLAKEQAEEATALKDKYVSLVSHDLKGPLASMLGFLMLLEKHIMEEKEGSFRDGTKLLLDSAIMSGKNMNTLIEELLDIGRLKTGKVKLSPRFANPHTIAAQVLADLGTLAQKKGVRIHNNIPAGARVFADPLLFSQVIQNLVSNAIKFCNRGDTIKLFTPEKEPSTIAVEDTGIGIKPAMVKDLFNYEKKTSTPGTGGELGTGLGLPFSREIMEAHGGGLTVVSSAGKGSVFYARLPDVKPVVLLVDEDPSMRGNLKQLLRRLDVEFTEATNGVEATNIIKRKAPHLIITKTSMPLMDGFELLEWAKSNAATKSIPLIMTTSDPAKEVRECALRSGADDFIAEEAGPGEFINRVSRFVGT